MLNLKLDHLLIGGPDLESTAEWFEKLSGVTPVPGGVHPNLGTANYLVSLGSGRYLELIGAIPGEKPHTLGKAFNAFLAPEVFWFAAASDDLLAHSVAMKNFGMDTAGPIAGSRRSNEGHELTWKILEIGQHEFGGCLPFMIDWEKTPHPSITIRPMVSFKSFRVTHPRAFQLQKIYRSLGLEVTIQEGDPRLELTLDTPRGSIVLTGTGSMPWFQSTRHGVFNRDSAPGRN